jgi:hypothetical protein
MPAVQNEIVYLVSTPRPTPAPIPSHQRESSELSRRTTQYAVTTHHRKSKETYWKRLATTTEDGVVVAARAASTCAQRPPPIARAIRPTSTSTIPCTSTAKKRSPFREGPKRERATRPMNGVAGGYAT